MAKIRRWTPDKIAEVLAYHKEHTHQETLDHFRISGGQLHVWKNKLPSGYYSKKRKAKAKANGAQPRVNGLADLPEREALQWLGRWRQAYFDQLKAETPSAETVFRALRGGK